MILGTPGAGAQPQAYHGPKQNASWSPYDNNGGTCLAVAGDDYCIVAADTRMSTGFSILSRNESKLMQMSDTCVLASAGFLADAKTLQKRLHARHVIYQHNQNKPMSCPAMAQLLSNTLYMKRFFPFYTFNICAGLDSEGKGCVYGYDAIGSYERSGYMCQGSGQSLMMPVLDNQLNSPSPLLQPPQEDKNKLSEEQALDLVKDCFATAGERDIYTGDKVEIIIMNKSGVRKEYLQLKLD
mmetsp:Transcript_60146/g.191075  ORF Transcript_60146/g.191075 Transcript_60146/m.191075 type:complete len:240 (+) Transcript_60146:152-871(+)